MISVIRAEKKADFSAFAYSLLCTFFSEGFSLPPGAWDRLRHLNVFHINIKHTMTTRVSNGQELVLSEPPSSPRNQNWKQSRLQMTIIQENIKLTE